MLALCYIVLQCSASLCSRILFQVCFSVNNLQVHKAKLVYLLCGPWPINHNSILDVLWCYMWAEVQYGLWPSTLTLQACQLLLFLIMFGCSLGLRQFSWVVKLFLSFAFLLEIFGDSCWWNVMLLLLMCCYVFLPAVCKGGQGGVYQCLSISSCWFWADDK